MKKEKQDAARLSVTEAMAKQALLATDVALDAVIMTTPDSAENESLRARSKKAKKDIEKAMPLLGKELTKRSRDVISAVSTLLMDFQRNVLQVKPRTCDDAFGQDD